jgi:hypothetical protein
MDAKAARVNTRKGMNEDESLKTGSYWWPCSDLRASVAVYQ